MGINGQKLLRRCRELLDENGELATQLGEELLQDMKVLILMERKRGSHLRAAHKAAEDRAAHVDTANEQMQQKIADLGRQCRDSRIECDKIREELEAERKSAKAGKRPAS